MAAQIGTEIVQQNEIIDDIGEEVFQFCVSPEPVTLFGINMAALHISDNRFPFSISVLLPAKDKNNVDAPKRTVSFLTYFLALSSSE